MLPLRIVAWLVLGEQDLFDVLNDAAKLLRLLNEVCSLHVHQVLLLLDSVEIGIDESCLILGSVDFRDCLFVQSRLDCCLCMFLLFCFRRKLGVCLASCGHNLWISLAYLSLIQPI